MTKRAKVTEPKSEAPKSEPKIRKAADAVVTLTDLCRELKHDPKLARAKLRAAVKDAKQFPELAKSHTAREAWEWPKASPAVAEARKAITG